MKKFFETDGDDDNIGDNDAGDNDGDDNDTNFVTMMLFVVILLVI